MIDGSGGISFDALNWMSEQQIEFVRLDWRGEITNVAGRSGYAGNSKLIQAQKEIKGTKSEIEIARHLIVEKIAASIKALKLIIPKSEIREIAISRLDKKYFEIRNSQKSIAISRLLGIEGVCARCRASRRCLSGRSSAKVTDLQLIGKPYGSSNDPHGASNVPFVPTLVLADQFVLIDARDRDMVTCSLDSETRVLCHQ
jgi:hypothetical protein